MERWNLLLKETGHTEIVPVHWITWVISIIRVSSENPQFYRKENKLQIGRRDEDDVEEILVLKEQVKEPMKWMEIIRDCNWEL